MERIIRVASQEITTTVSIRNGISSSERLFSDLFGKAQRYALITDERVDGIWGQTFLQTLREKGLDVLLLSFPAGEASKSREIKQKLEDQMLDAKMGRDSGVIALGGGVVMDLAAFLASTYCRGVPLFLIPTTLLAMVDACIGGKAAVNTPHSKNSIGSFYQPSAIYIDPDFLNTLPEKELKNGMAEVIKYALIASPSLFYTLKTQVNLPEIISQSCSIKLDVIEADPKEKGLRRILNFGHTIGHALETLSNYQMTHGEAIAIGMITESYLSMQLGYLKKEDFESIRQLFIDYDFPLRLPFLTTPEKIIEKMVLDKKSLNSTPRFVLLKEIGTPLSFNEQYCTPVPLDTLKNTLNWMIQCFAIS